MAHRKRLLAEKTSLSLLIRSTRNSRKMSTQHAADLLGISEPRLVAIERGAVRITAKLAESVALFLGVKTDSVLSMLDRNSDGKLLDLSLLLRHERERREIGIDRAGELLGVSGTMVSMMERGVRPVTERLAPAVAAFLDLKPEEVMLMAGHMPWVPTPAQARKVVQIFQGA